MYTIVTNKQKRVGKGKNEQKKGVLVRIRRCSFRRVTRTGEEETMPAGANVEERMQAPPSCAYPVSVLETEFLQVERVLAASTYLPRWREYEFRSFSASVSAHRQVRNHCR